MENPRKDFWPLIFDLRPLFFLCALCVSVVNILAQDTTAPVFPQQPDLDSYRLKIATGSTEGKREALYQLRNINTPEASRIAVLALQDTDEVVRVTATHSVLALPSDEAFAALLPLLGDKLPYVREETAYAIGKTKNQKGVEPLILLLQKDKIEEVRGAAAFGLGLIGDVRAEDALMFALQKDKNLFVQRSAARSLGQVKSRKALPLLTAILRDPKRHDDVKRESARALGDIGDPQAIEILKQFSTAADYYLADICKESLQKLQKVADSAGK